MASDDKKKNKKHTKFYLYLYFIGLIRSIQSQDLDQGQEIGGIKKKQFIKRKKRINCKN